MKSPTAGTPSSSNWISGAGRGFACFGAGFAPTKRPRCRVVRRIRVALPVVRVGRVARDRRLLFCRRRSGSQRTLGSYCRRSGHGRRRRGVGDRPGCRARPWEGASRCNVRLCLQWRRISSLWLLADQPLIRRKTSWRSSRRCRCLQVWLWAGFLSGIGGPFSIIRPHPVTGGMCAQSALAVISPVDEFVSKKGGTDVHAAAIAPAPTDGRGR